MRQITPVPTTRSSEALVVRRFLTQVQSDQLALLHAQNQLSTGRRISTPSEDAPAALRAITLQRLLERKQQVAVNLQTSKSYLTATENSLTAVSDVIIDIRGVALSVTSTVSTDDERRAAAVDVQRAFDQLLDIANQQFRGRYLFGGTRTSEAPYQKTNSFASYRGNESELRSFADLDLLFATNISGNDVFGGLSDEVRGFADLNPIVTERTQLADLRGGLGITKSSIHISDGARSSTVDVSSAETLGDVIRLIESNPPDGRTLTVRLSDHGLTVKLDDAGGGNLTIKELGGGSTAAELGILETTGVFTDTLLGEDLNPRLRPTTRLDNILGVRSQAIFTMPGSNNDLIVQAKENGPALSGVAIQFVDDDLLQAASGLTVGSETVAFSATARAARASLALPGADNDLILTGDTAGVALNNVAISVVSSDGLGDAANVTYDGAADPPTLTIEIDDAGPDATTLGTLVNAINNNSPFTAAADDSAGEGYDPAGQILGLPVGGIATTTGNSGGEANTLYIHIDAGATTANDVVRAVATDPTVSQLFDVRIDPKDTTSLSTAGLGIIPVNATAVTSGGAGEQLDRDAGIVISNGGKQAVIYFSDVETVEQLINKINRSGMDVRASINAAGDGLDVRSTISGTDLFIGENGGTTATQLGIRTMTAASALADLNYGRGVRFAEGTDFTIRRNDGVELEIDISSAGDIQDVLDRINTHAANQGPGAVIARLASVGNGIELVDDNPVGAGELTIIRNVQSEAAWDLGLMPRETDEITSSQSAPAEPAAALVTFPPPNEQNTAFSITANEPGTAQNGVEIIFQAGLTGDLADAVFLAGTKQLVVTIDPTQTRAATVISAINNEGTFYAEPDTTSDATNDASGVIGFVGAAGTTSGGQPERYVGADVAPVEVKSVFTTLRRLQEALLSNDLPEIQRMTAALEDDLSRLSFARAELGARGRALDTMDYRLQDETIELRETLSLEIDIDLAEAITRMTSLQAAYEASLRTLAEVYRVTLLDFI